MIDNPQKQIISAYPDAATVQHGSTVSGLTTQSTYDGQEVMLDTNSDSSTVEYWNGVGRRRQS